MKLLLKSSVVFAGLVFALGLMARPGIRELTGRLSASSPRVRAQAALILGGMRAKSAVFFLVDCLKDSSPVVRGTCARALGMIGDDRGLAAVARLGNSSDKFVRRWSQWAARHMLHSDTELRVATPEPKGGSAQMHSGVLDGISRVILDIDAWEFSQEMDFSDDKKAAIEGIGAAPAPVLTIRTGINTGKAGGIILVMSGKVGNTFIAGMTCKVSAKDVAVMDKLIEQSRECAAKLVKKLINGGSK